jgi:hypothetical protein
MLHALFLSHPRAVGESYTDHLTTALEFGLRLILAGCACVIHAFIPALFERTASLEVVRLHARVIASRQRRLEPRPDLDYAI